MSRFIKVPLKGCELYLTPAEYVAAIGRGKRIRRWANRCGRSLAKKPNRKQSREGDELAFIEGN